MSLGCLECKQIGAFNTLVIFDPEGEFDAEKHVSSYPNFYTCCATLSNFPEVDKSRFMVVQQPQFESMWHTGNSGPKLNETQYKYVDEAVIRGQLPKIFKGLLARPTKKKEGL